MSWSVKVTDASLAALNTENRGTEIFLRSKVHVQDMQLYGIFCFEF